MHHTRSPSRPKPEVMSPAGYWPQLRAAIEAGADAVYFGLKHFSARAKVGFALAELPDAMKTLRLRGVRGFVTFNTLVFEHEIGAAAKTIAAVAEAGADALIVQDLGIAKLAREIAPDLELHASTQMSITNAEGVRFAQACGVDRVTLARELSLEEIRAIIDETDCELEIFVHGALCVAYSGQCFSSEAWGGRSANRGQCAQACRLPYEMLVDGVGRPLGDVRYLLSPGDLYALKQVPEMVGMGVAALKIEGRYKDADYVALATRAYRKAVDEAYAGQPLSAGPEEELRLAQVYSRGFGPHFLSGTNHQAVVEGRAPRHRGLLMGQVTRIENETVILAPADALAVTPLKPGDGVVFDAADWRSPEEKEEGGRVYECWIGRAGSIEVRFGNGAIRFDRIRVGDLLWRTHDPELDREARPYLEARTPLHRQELSVRVSAREGEPLEAEWRLEKSPGVRVVVRSPTNLTAATNKALSPDLLWAQFGRLGNTAYRVSQLDVDLSGSPFAPVSLLNQMRREAIERLTALQSEPKRRAVREVAVAAEKSRAAALIGRRPVSLHLLVRTPEQLVAALEVKPASITLDYLDLFGLRPSVARVKAAGFEARVASPRVLKPGEAKIVDFLLSLECSIVVRGSGMIEKLNGRAHPDLIGDFSLNTANSVTGEMLIQKGLKRITPAHDLNGEQVAELAEKLGPERIEAIAYQHMPVFHTEHCVFCRFLSKGTSHRDCGRPCERHRVALRDQNGREHPVLADVGCRNTVFGAEAQEASGHLETWLRAGVSHLRLEFVNETAEDVAAVTRAFEDALSERIAWEQLAGRLGRIAPQGTTEGSFYVPKDYAVLPVLQ